MPRLVEARRFDMKPIDHRGGKMGPAAGGATVALEPGPSPIFAMGSGAGIRRSGAPLRAEVDDRGVDAPILKHSPRPATRYLGNPTMEFYGGCSGTDLVWSEWNVYPRNDLARPAVIVGPGRWNRKHSVEEERTDDAEERAQDSPPGGPDPWSRGLMSHRRRSVAGLLFLIPPRRSRCRARSRRGRPGKMTEDGKIHKLEVKPGDRILMSKYAGSEVKIEGQEFVDPARG